MLTHICCPHIVHNIISLDVIPGDAYKVEKSGDENSGFVTKVVFADKYDDEDEKIDGDSKKKKKGKESKVDKPDDKPAAAKDNAESTKETTPVLTKKERQKIKRKRKREEAKERKRLKRESGEEEDDTKIVSDKSNTSSAAAVPSKAVDESKQEDTEDESTLQQITALQTSWSIQTSITLHETLATGLHKLQYTYPTPIQAATLPAAVLGRRDIVGAAPTGSGKTLSYGLPILQYLLDNVVDATLPSTTPKQQPPLQALILTPTRELAIQVTCELTKVSMNIIKIGTIVGGFAEVKQRRTLEKIRPSVIVATPGRLWELVSCCFLICMCVGLCLRSRQE